MINASPFQYSGVQVSYAPLKGVGDNQDTASYSGGNFDTTILDNELLGCSSRPHAYMYPQYSKGCQLNLPFFYYKDWLNLDGSLTALDNMGVVKLISLDELRTATTPAVQPITISVFAWATDVQLAGPSYVLQGPDEYAERPVSVAMSAISAAANSLSVIQPISRYAKATAMVAKAGSDLARWFGFSNPPVITDVHASRINYLSNFASPEISVQVDKLALDPKQEVTVDPRTVGLDGTDEMAIRNILDRDVLINRIDWEVTDTPGTVLYIKHVTPMVANTSSYTGITSGSTVYSCQPSPFAHLGAAFRLWRGDITYKFTCLTSQFHRGRLRLTFEPDGWQSSYGSSVLTQPRQISKIWDITQHSSVEFTVPYLADKPFLETMGCRIFDNPADIRFVRPTLPGVGGFVDNRFNGSVILSVVNELVSSDPAAQVMILCEMNCANVEFANPGNINRALSVYKLQGPDDDVHELASEPTEVTKMEVPTVLSFPIHDVFVGEVCRSIRQLLHRHNRYGIWSSYNGRQTNVPSTVATMILPTYPSLDAVNGNDITDYGFAIPLPRLPLMSGCIRQEGVSGQALYSGLTYVNNSGWKLLPTDFEMPTMTSYLSCAYAGWRGSHDYKAVLRSGPVTTASGAVVTPEIGNLQISRNTDMPPNTMANNWSTVNRVARNAYVVFADDRSTATYSGNVSLDAYASQNYCSTLTSVANGGSGTSITNTEKVNVVDAVVPHYSTYRFLPANPKTNFLTASGYTSLIFGQEGNAVNTLDDGVIVTGTVSCPSKFSTATQIPNLPKVELYHAAGVDFSLFMYLNPPTFYKYGNTISGFIDQAPFVSQL